MVTARRLTIVMVLVGLAVGAWIAPTIGVRATRFERTTADEPQYLLTAISLGEDFDLSVADERAEQRYRPFHEVDLPLQEEVQADGSAVSPHDPLLPAFLAAPIRVGGWVAAKLAMALLAGLLAAALVWVAVRRFAVPLTIAVVTVVVFAASAPFAFYGTQIYPELPAALVVTVAIAALTGAMGRRGLVALALAVVALLWLSVKYAPVAGVLVAIALVVLWRRGDRREAVGLAVGLAAAGAVYLGAHHALYGGWTVYASGAHFSTTGEAGVMGVTPDYAGRANRLLGLLTDRGFGLAAWQPAFLFAIPAAAALLRRRPRGWPVLALPLAAGWLNATFVALTMHGWWWPGRQVVVVLPCAVLAIAWWVGQYRPARPWLVVTGVLGIVSAAWLTVECLLRDRTLIFDFDGTTNPWYRVWQLVLPDDRLQPAGTLLLHAVWLGLAVLLALWGWRSVRAGGRGTLHVPSDPSVRSIEQENHECEPASVLVASP